MTVIGLKSLRFACLVPLVLIAISLPNAHAVEVVDFNICRSFQHSERDNCLLRLSQKLSDLPGELANPNVGRLQAGFIARDGMWTDSEDYSNIGQHFVTSLTPELTYRFSHGQSFRLSWTVFKFASTGIADDGPSYLTRPELSSLFPIRVAGINWQIGGGVRPPGGKSYARYELHQMPLDRVWEISLRTLAYLPLASRWTLFAETGLFYNTDHNYATYPKSVYGQTLEVGHFNQWPLTSKSKLGVKRSFNTFQFDVAWIGQYGFSGRKIVTGDPDTANGGDANDVYALPGMRYSAIEIGSSTNVADWFVGDVRIVKSFGSHDGFEPRFYANPDDPALSANLLLSISATKDF